jgi:hypothetical protein
MVLEFIETFDLNIQSCSPCGDMSLVFQQGIYLVHSRFTPWVEGTLRPLEIYRLSVPFNNAAWHQRKFDGVSCIIGNRLNGFNVFSGHKIIVQKNPHLSETL